MKTTSLYFFFDLLHYSDPVSQVFFEQVIDEVKSKKKLNLYKNKGTEGYQFFRGSTAITHPLTFSYVV